MKKFVLGILALFLPFAGVIQATDSALPAQPAVQQELFSPEITQAIKELDPVKFKAAMDAFGLPCKYGKMVLLGMFMTKAQNIQLGNIADNLSGIVAPIETNISAKGLLGGISMSFVIAGAILASVEWGKWTFAKKGLVALALSTLGTAGLFGINADLKAEQEKKAAKDAQNKQRREEQVKQLEKLYILAKIIADMPTKECC